MKHIHKIFSGRPDRSWSCLGLCLALWCVAAAPLIAAAPAEPILAVASFGLTEADAAASVAPAGPTDFAFGGNPAAAAASRRFTGPVSVTPGDTWPTVLARSQVPAEAWPKLFGEPGFAHLAPSVKGDWPQRVLPDTKVWIEWRADLNPQAVYLALSPRTMLRARQVNGVLQVDTATRAGSTLPGAVAGASLYRRADQVGVPEGVVDQMVAIFSGEVDFHRDLDKGFKGTVLYQMDGEAGQAVRPGRLLAVHLTAAGRELSAYAFDDGSQTLADALPGIRPTTLSKYFSAQGYPVERSFLQSPIVFSRITSGFSVARFHPILNRWRAHTGIDFAAPLGTPVRATANGKIEFAGVRGEYGNLISVQHGGGRSTYYGHLQGFAKGVTNGTVLHQGDLIGRVGMTGMATGPHLHYEMRQGGQPFDPTLHKETTMRLNPNQLERFDHLVQWYEKQLSASHRSRFVVP